MKAADLPALTSITDPTEIIPQAEIDRINDLYVDMRRKARKILKEAMELGDWFLASRRKLGPHVKWSSWLSTKFPKISMTSIFTFQELARNREFIETFSRNESIPSITEAIRMISQKKRTPKPRIRGVMLREDAEPIVVLEAKLKNFVINLYLLRYLEVEIKGLLESIDLTADQVLKVLRYVCKEHPEVEEEVMKTFKPPLKVVSNDV